MTIVPDTNVIVSGILIPTGIEAHLIHLWREARISFAVSPAILAEYRAVLHRPKILHHTNLSAQEINLLVDEIGSYSMPVEGKHQVTIPIADPTDAKFLACAVEANADAVVTGDKRHLLPLKSYRDIPIVSPRECVEIFLITKAA